MMRSNNARRSKMVWLVMSTPSRQGTSNTYSGDDARIYYKEHIDERVVLFWDISDSFVKKYCGPFRELAVDALKDFCSGNFDCVARLNECGEFETVIDPFVLS